MARLTQKLNALDLRSYMKAAAPVAVSDGGGLTFTLSAAGVAAWVLRYRYAGRGKELTLGRYPDLSLAAARELAGQHRAEIQRGIDVAAKKQEQIRGLSRAFTFGALVEDYLSKVLPDLAANTQRQRRQHLTKHVKRLLGTIPARAVTAEDVSMMLRTTGSKTSPHVADMVLTAASETFKHGQRIGAVTTNPCIGLSAFAIVGRPEPTRPRLMLTEDELRQLLPALPTIGRVNQIAVLILLTTCVRIGELARAEWTDIDFAGGVWRIPDANSKTKAGFTVPLTSQAILWFRELEALACGSRFVLPARQSRRWVTHGKEMPFEQRSLNAMLHKLTDRLNGVRRFTPHDLRSTARSHLAALGVNVLVAERCLNHSLGGLLAVYDQHDYLNERRVALAKLTEFIVNCQSGVPNDRGENLIPLRAVA